MTLIELLVAILFLGVPLEIGTSTARAHGVCAGLAAGLITAIACAAMIYSLWQALNRVDARRRKRYRERYKKIFRVIAMPSTACAVCKPEGAEIRVGDNGWEAPPMHDDDGLVYLQGLTVDWYVAWHAGFRRDEIEFVRMKPVSQFDWPDGIERGLPECPFPIQERATTAMGFPI